MPNDACYQMSRTYALFVTKEVLKEAAGGIFDDLRQTLNAHFADTSGSDCREQAKRVMELLSDVECRYYNTFDLGKVFDEVTER